MLGENFEIAAQYYEVQTFKKGDILTEPGQICDWIGIVNSGIVRNYHSVDGKEHINQIYFPLQAVSDYVSFTTGEPARVFIDVVKDTEISMLRKAGVQELRERFPAFEKSISDYLSMIYVVNFERYSSLLLDSAETRYLKLLKQRPEIIQQVPLYMVASYLGITPEALSRVRNKIAQTGA